MERRCINRNTFILNTYNEIQLLVEYRFLIGNILKMLPQMPKELFYIEHIFNEIPICFRPISHQYWQNVKNVDQR